MVQFGSFLSMQLSTEEFVKRLPSVDTLIMSYNVPADAAFFLCRTQYAYAINVRIHMSLSCLYAISSTYKTNVFLNIAVNVSVLRKKLFNLEAR